MKYAVLRPYRAHKKRYLPGEVVDLPEAEGNRLVSKAVPVVELLSAPESEPNDVPTTESVESVEPSPKPSPEPQESPVDDSSDEASVSEVKPAPRRRGRRNEAG